MKKSLFVLALLPLFLTACGGAADSANSNAAPAAAEQPAAVAANADPILAEPMVGDLYAAKLSAFSKADFNDGDDKELSDAFGLMKVVAVDSDKIVVITEDAAWEVPQGAKSELHGDLKDITWDESERINIKRSELQSLKERGDILDTRRM